MIKKADAKTILKQRPAGDLNYKRKRYPAFLLAANHSKSIAALVTLPTIFLIDLFASAEAPLNIALFAFFAGLSSDVNLNRPALPQAVGDQLESELDDLVKLQNERVICRLKTILKPLTSKILIKLHFCELEAIKQDFGEVAILLNDLTKSASQCILKTRQFITKLEKERTIFEYEHPEFAGYSSSTDAELQNKLLKLIDSDREKLAQNLHDTLLQELCTILLGAQFCQQLIFMNQDKLLREIGHLKNLAKDMHAHAIACPYGAKHTCQIINGDLLLSTLQDFIESFHKSSHLAIVLKIPSKDKKFLKEKRVSGRLKNTGCHILQEALVNAYKHAQASVVSIEIRFEADQLTIIVEDNGRGFLLNTAPPKSNTLKHMGLKAMFENAKRLGGQLEIISRPGDGTKILANLPITGGRSSASN